MVNPRTSFWMFSRHASGSVAIEFAFIAPILILILLGVIEFGMQYLKHMDVERAVAATSQAIESDPLDPQNQNLARHQAAYVNFTASGNYICAKAYTTRSAAVNGNCSGSVWQTDAPSSSRNPYFVLVKAHIGSSSMTSLMDAFISNINNTQVVKVGGTADVPCGEGEVALSDGNGGYTCEKVAAGQFCYGDRLNNRKCWTMRVATTMNEYHANQFGSGNFDINPAYCSAGGWKCADTSACTKISQNRPNTNGFMQVCKGDPGAIR